MSRKLLIVSPRFPPSNAADMHRVRQSLPYFRDNDWEATVLAVEPADADVPQDPLLLRTVPEWVRVVRTPALSRRTGLGTIDLRALPHLARAGSRLLEKERFDLIFFSTTAFSIAAMGRVWRRRFGVPYVVDMQDPWLSDYYDRPGAPPPPGGWMKYRLSQRIARVLEPWTMRGAAHVISVSPAYPEMLRARYRWMRAEEFTVLPFGAPEDDFELLRRDPVAQGLFDPHDGNRHWLYVGRAGDDMALALRALFTALHEARQRRPEEFERLRLHFVGTDYAPEGRARKTVEPVAAACGVGDLVEERPSRVPYFEALQGLLDADALIVPGSDDPGYTASKIFPYLLAGKPLLALFHERSSVVEIIRSARAGVVVPFASSEAPQQIAARVGEAWFAPRAWERAPATDWGAIAPYTARAMTARQCALFTRLVQEPSHTTRET